MFQTILTHAKVYQLLQISYQETDFKKTYDLSKIKFSAKSTGAKRTSSYTNFKRKKVKCVCFPFYLYLHIQEKLPNFVQCLLFHLY